MAESPSALSSLLVHSPKFLFFTGKGGVGKTSIASATAVALADLGRRVLIVSTDPASNLDEVLETPLDATPRAVAGVPGLDASNLDPLVAAAAYRERVVGPYRGVLPELTVANIEEQLSGACTVEIAAFDEFVTLLANPEATAAYEHVIFDTAPTGHTLRMLSLPGAWDEFMDASTLGVSCIGPLAGLTQQHEAYRRAIAALADAERTLLVLVTRADDIALDEAARASRELAALGIVNQRLVLNGVLHAPNSEDSLAVALTARSARAIAEAPAILQDLPRDVIPLFAWSPRGVDALRAVGSHAPAPAPAPLRELTSPTEGLSELIDAVSANGSGLVMTMGKGGVGKTTLAVAVALELARRGHRVHLSTTDPAAHLDAVLAESATGLTGLTGLSVHRIDPEAVTAEYTAEVMAEAGADLDDAARAVLEEDLRSPCTAEIAVFRAFARTVGEAVEGFVVLDTAPTGHTLLLLDSARAYHQEVLRQGGVVPEDVERLLERLGDPDFTSVLIVTLPEATPVHEAAALQDDLRRAGIEPRAWIVNQSLFAAGVTEPTLSARADAETNVINEVLEMYSPTLVLLPMLGEPPIGTAGIKRLLATSASAATTTADA